jgi:tetratricopeptide (TPR) repeat protein
MRGIGLLVLLLVLAAVLWAGRASVYYHAGTWALKLEKHELAARAFSRALRLSPEHKLAFAARGRAYWRIGRYELADKDFQSAIDVDPAYAAPYCHRGTMMLEAEMGSSDEAIYYLNKAIDFDPGYTTPYLILGQFYEQTGQAGKAEGSFTKALQSTRQKGRAHYLRARHYSKRYNPNASQKDFKTACEQYGFAPACAALRSPGQAGLQPGESVFEETDKARPSKAP